MKILQSIQQELKAPKSQFNSFGKYNYRSCEDILEGLKPLLKKHDAVLTISDDIVLVGDRVYVKATVTLKGKDEEHTTTAFARESLDKKGMDESQITGTASSYARKYALNGLFCIDDTKDADATNDHGKGQATKPQVQKPEQKQPPKEKELTPQQLLYKKVEAAIDGALNLADLDSVNSAHMDDIGSLPEAGQTAIYAKLDKKRADIAGAAFS